MNFVFQQRLVQIVAKRARDKERRTIVVLKKECALLARPQLLLDMEHKIYSVVSVKNKFTQLEQSYTKKKDDSTTILKKINTYRTRNF